MIYLILRDITTNRDFIKYFNSEFAKDKYKRRIKYSKKLIVISDSSDYFDE